MDFHHDPPPQSGHFPQKCFFKASLTQLTRGKYNLQLDILCYKLELPWPILLVSIDWSAQKSTCISSYLQGILIKIIPVTFHTEEYKCKFYQFHFKLRYPNTSYISSVRNECIQIYLVQELQYKKSGLSPGLMGWQGCFGVP